MKKNQDLMVISTRLKKNVGSTIIKSTSYRFPGKTAINSILREKREVELSAVQYLQTSIYKNGLI